MSRAAILLADNDRGFLRVRKEYLEACGYTVLTATTPEEAKQVLCQHRPDAVIMDVRLNDDDDELDMSGLRVLQDAPVSMPKLILTGYPTVELARQALRQAMDGRSLAVDFVMKSEGSEAMLRALETALVRRQVQWGMGLGRFLRWLGLLVFVITVLLVWQLGVNMLEGLVGATFMGVVSQLLGNIIFDQLQRIMTRGKPG